VATDDLHAPLGLGRPAAGRPIAHSVAAAVLGIATAAVVIGATVWYEPLTRSLPTPAPPQVASPAKPEPAVAASSPATPRVVPALPLPARPQITGAIPPARGPDGNAFDPSPDNPSAAPGRAERVITIIDGRSGARQEVRIPATSEGADTPLPDPGLADPLRGGTVLGADDAPESLASPPLALPPRAKPGPPPQKRTAAKPGQTLSTNSATQAPLR
jgi:hypothetical protein